MDTLRQVFLLAMMVSLAIQGVSAVDNVCPSTAEPEEFNIDVFTELLSNHTDIASTIRAAPVIGNMDPNAPAYEFDGMGIHITDQYLSDSIRAHSCATNEVTLIGAVFFKENDAAGPLLELSYADGFGQSPPVLSLRMDALADEIIIAYRHLGDLHTEVFNVRLHGRKWRTYAVTLSGNQISVYENCRLLHQRIVPLPDYCANDSSLMLSVADSALQEGERNRMLAYLQNLRIHFGQRGIQQMCPDLPEMCPTCGRFLKMTERVYSLTQEVKKLRERVDELEASGVPGKCVSSGKECSRTVGGSTISFADRTFMSFSDQTICFCLDGEAQCSSNVCNETSSDPNSGNDPGSLLTTAAPTPSPTTEPPFVGCPGDEIVDPLREGEMFTIKDQSVCRVYTCELGALAFERKESPFECLTNYTACFSNFTDLQQRVAQCCRSCPVCSFVTCPGETVCEVDSKGQPICGCGSGFEQDSTSNCVDINECESDTSVCPEKSKCVNTRGSFNCICEAGYNLALSSDGSMSCEDDDECASQDTNNCNDTMMCVNLPGSYSCVCPNGTSLSQSGVCENDTTCDPPCLNGGTCVDSSICRCHSGYTGDRCEEDVDECKENTHTCRGINAVCINTQGGFFCRCSSGYMGDGHVCEDIDECALNLDNCLPEATCFNRPGSYECRCERNEICTGNCRLTRRGMTYELNNTKSLVLSNCRNCTCLNGIASCVKIKCDCGANPPSGCCPECYQKNCIVKGSVRIRPGQTWVNPQNRCETYHCGNNLVAVRSNLSENCPKLDCPASLTIHPMGKCCPVCLLHPCTESNNKQSVTVRNGCETCTCSNSEWDCQRKVLCPSNVSCDPRHILFTENGCCPVCADQVFESSQCEA